MYLVRKTPNLELTARLTTLLYPTVKHLAFRARQKAERFDGDDDVLARLPAPRREEWAVDDLRDLLGGLSDGHREVVLMRFVDGMTLAEIAAALAIPAGTVKSRLHHAIRALRDDPSVAAYFERE